MEGNIKSLVALLCLNLSEEDVQHFTTALQIAINEDVNRSMVGVSNMSYGKFCALLRIEDALINRSSRRNPNADPSSVENAVPIALVDGAASFDYKHVAVLEYPPFCPFYMKSTYEA